MSAHDSVEDLKKLIALRDSGAITEAEFSTLKTRMIFGSSSTLPPKPATPPSAATEGHVSTNYAAQQHHPAAPAATPTPQHTPKRGSWSTRLIVAGLLLYGIYWLGSTPSSTASEAEPSQAMYNYVNKVHHCTWCGNEYRGNGYIHVMDNCEPASGNFAKIDVQCSTKCCMESWNSGRR